MRFKIIRVIVGFCLITALTFSCKSSVIIKYDLDKKVNFIDPLLERAVRSKIGKMTGELTYGDVYKIRELEFKGFTKLGKIRDISGLEYLTALKTLDLAHNDIVELKPLEDLTSVTKLYLQANKIVDISTLKNLTALTELNLNQNRIVDINVLQNLVNLRVLALNTNLIVDISPLENIRDINALILGSNLFTDISPLEKLEKLVYIHLYDNQISNIRPLLNNVGLGKNDTLWITYGNNVSSEDIEKLKSKGVTVE